MFIEYRLQKWLKRTEKDKFMRLFCSSVFNLFSVR